MENTRGSEKCFTVYVFELPVFAGVQHNEQPRNQDPSSALDQRLRIHFPVDPEHPVELFTGNHAGLGL